MNRRTLFAPAAPRASMAGAPALPHGRGRRWMASLLAVATIALAWGCGGASASPGNSAATPGSAASAFEGVYQATWSGTASVDGAAPQPWTMTGVITVTSIDDNDIEMAWQIAGSAPSGSITFAVAGNAATAAGGGTGGSCWMGVLSNGDQQTACATSATAQIDGDTLVQNQTGTVTGVTTDNVPYSGTYEGAWTGVRTQTPAQ